jgi:hypothetical protein
LPWNDLIEQARRSLGEPNFENRERLYKQEIGAELRQVFELAESGGDWATALRRAFAKTYGPPGFRDQYNLSRFNQHQWLYKLEGEPAEEARALLARMRGTGDAFERGDYVLRKPTICGSNPQRGVHEQERTAA